MFSNGKEYSRETGWILSEEGDMKLKVYYGDACSDISVLSIFHNSPDDIIHHHVSEFKEVKISDSEEFAK